MLAVHSLVRLGLGDGVGVMDGISGTTEFVPVAEAVGLNSWLMGVEVGRY
jgi:hypothetical protein